MGERAEGQSAAAAAADVPVACSVSCTMSNSEHFSDSRPSPEALLAISGSSRRGRLKVFLGAAPGVGKTYAMLQAAQQRRREGIDVVIGIVETHGRPETRSLMQGLGLIPRVGVEYRGRHLEEMNLDAILNRKPQLVLVDELAHTNVPGSRHPKRYQDVEELLSVGIDVYATLNVQHIESLNDAVARITQIRVQETIPDSVIEQASEIQLIDLPPEELLQRLRDGKVYVPETAQRAIDHFFRPGNLNALRELALRRVAERVDDQMQDYMRASAIGGPWPTTERIMVCVGPSPLSARLVRAAKRRADRRNAPWLAVYVEMPAHHSLSEADSARVERTLRMAEQLGGETVTIPGHRPAEDLIRFARSRNVTEIIVGKSQRSWWYTLRYGSLVNDLISHSGPVDIYVISSDESRLDQPPAGQAAPREAGFRQYLGTTIAVAAAALVAKGFEHFISLPNLSIIFLLGVLFSATRYGLWPSAYASVLSALVYNFFFIEPRHTFTIASSAELLAFIAYFIIAVVAGNLTARLRAQAEAARRREDRTAALFALSRAIAGTTGGDSVARIISSQVSQILKARTAVLVPDGPGLVQKASDPPAGELSETEMAAATWAWQHGQPAGRGSDTLPGVPWLFLPLRTAHEVVGVLGVLFEDGPVPLSLRRQRLLEGLSDLSAVAIERTRLVEQMEQTRVIGETERLRSALLSSISHDLRTPLAAIIGSASSLLAYGQGYDDSARRELLLTIQEEAERLNRFVGNLLDITRLESGRLELNRQWVGIEDVIGTAIARLLPILSGHGIETRIEPGLPLLRLDFVMIEQVLVNLLDNAAKYSNGGKTITLSSRREGDEVIIEVVDEGSGIPEEDLERVFDKFYRVRSGDRHVAGTGLGLSICRGLIEAHGGRIRASHGPGGRGTVMRITLPVETQPLAHARVESS